MSKKERYNLSKEVNKVSVAIAWNYGDSESNVPEELDLHIFMCDEHGKCPNEDYIVSYKHNVDPENSIDTENHYFQRVIYADWFDGFTIEFDKVAPWVQHIKIALAIFDATARKQDLTKMLKDLSVKIFKKDLSEEIYHYDMNPSFEKKTCVLVGDLSKVQGNWGFDIIEEGYDSLEELYKEMI